MSDDVLTLLERDHRSVASLLGRFDGLPPEARDDYFCEVVQTLVGHEVAEELVFYPALRDRSDGGAVADARLAEQAEAEELLADMESDDPASAAFTSTFEALRQAVLHHADAEESTAFPLLRRTSTPEERQELGARFTRAEKHAPTHPHPHAPDTPPGNVLLGPIAAMFDRARDAVQRA